MKIFKDLWWFFKAERKGYGVGLLALFIVSLTHLIPPLIIGKIIDHIVKRNLTLPLILSFSGILYTVYSILFYNILNISIP